MSTRSAQAQVAATSFLALFAIVGIALYGLPFFYDFMVREFGWSRAQVTSGNALSKLVVGPLFGFLAGWMVDRFGPRRLMVAGILMAGTALVGLGAIGTLAGFYFFYLFNALGYVCGGPLPNQVLLSRWFTAARGRAMGFAYLGIGIGGALVPFLAVWLTRAVGWQVALQALGGLIILVALPMALFVREAPDATTSGRIVEDGGGSGGSRGSVGPVFRAPAFYLLLIGSMCSIAAVGGTNQHLKLFLSLDHGYAQAEAAKIASLVLLSSLAGRLGMGWLADRIPKKYVMLLIYLIVASAIPLLFLTAMPSAIYLFAVIFGLGLGGEYMVIPLMAAELFGVRVLGRVMGIVLTADGVAEAVAPVLVGRMHDVTGSYATGFATLIAFALAGAVAIGLLPRGGAPRPAPSPESSPAGPVSPSGPHPLAPSPFRRGGTTAEVRSIGVIMNGVTGRMGLNQHLVRSIVAIRKQGGVALPGGDRLLPHPILVGRSESKLREIGDAHGIERVSTDLDACLANPADVVYFDATLTSLRADHVRRAIAAGKHVYCEKPLATTTAEALDLARLARRRGVKHGVVQDKLFLPGIRKLKRLVDGGFFGRILSVRGEFGYWVFEGDWGEQSAQRPSWNYRKEEGGGIILDMFAHWRYLLDHTFGAVKAVQCTGAKHIPERVDEHGRRYAATAEDAAYATFVLDAGQGEIVAQFNSSWAVRVHRDDLLQIQVDGTLGSAVAGLRGCKTQPRGDTPRAVWNPDVPNPFNFYDHWQEAPDEGSPDNAFKLEWEMFFRHVAADEPFPHDFHEGAKGVQLAELALTSWAERRWVEVPDLETSRPRDVGAQHAAPLLESSPPVPLSVPERGDVMSSPSPEGREGQGVRTILLPRADGTLEPYAMREPRAWTPPPAPIRSRVAYAAAHVVCDPLADCDPLSDAAVDWEATLAYRRHLWSFGLGVAEAMDTAQRGMGLGWPAARELIRRSVAEARATGGMIACGAGTDHLARGDGVTLDDVLGAYEEQVGYVEGQGGRVILMASRALARAAREPDDYRRVYGTILRQASRPVILHWLGDMFDPQLAGYWGTRDVREAMDVCLGIIREHRAKVDGIKISLLDAQREVEMRACLPDGVRMYTGDDLNYDRLILGEGGDEGGAGRTGGRHSDALLGIFDAIAPAASAALQALDRGDVAGYRAALGPTVPLSRHIFQQPTYAYKTGIVFLAYLNGHQAHFRMIGGAESWRSLPHLAELFRLADRAGLIADPERAAERMRRVLALGSVE